MTATLRPPADPTARLDGPPDPGATRSAVRRRLGLHLLALGVVLWVGALAVGIDHVVSADEGAVLGQAQVVERTGGYGATYWAAAIDPEGRWFPFDLSERHGDRWYLFTKKPLYVELVVTADGVAGAAGVTLLHVGAVVAAAGSAALVARRLRRGLDGWTVWAVGLGSPLVVDARWVIAHAPAAAVVTVAGLAALRARSGRRGAAPVVALGLIVATLLRNEATLWGAALVLVAGVVAVRDRDRRSARLALVAAIGTGLGVLVATVWQRAVEGGSDAGPYVVRDQVGWLAARASAVGNLVTTPQAGGAGGWVGPAILAASGFVAAAWWSGPRRARWAPGLAWAAVGLLVAALAGGATLVPGLVPAWSVGVAALAVAVGRRGRVDTAGRAAGDAAFLLATSGAFTLAVVATSYAAGGTGDWGARYLHLGLPLAVAVAVGAIARAADEVPWIARRLVAPLVAAAVVVALIGGAAVQRAVQVSRTIDRSARAAADANPDGDGRPAVVVSTAPAVGRQMWEWAVDGRSLTLDPRRGDLAEQAAELDRRLDGAGVGAVVIIGARPDVEAAMSGFTLCLDPSVDVDPIGETWVVASLRECPGTV